MGAAREGYYSLMSSLAGWAVTKTFSNSGAAIAGWIDSNSNRSAGSAVATQGDFIMMLFLLFVVGMFI
jgi:hypothetical protein